MKREDTRSLIVLGGRKIEMKRPRLRTRGGKGQEWQLPSYRLGRRAEDQLDRTHRWRRSPSGVATRKYRRVLDPPCLPTRARGVGVQ